MIKIFKKEQRTELGRTMMEMLATLVIVGVIIIGSVWGYRFALDIIMANSIVTGVRARSIVMGQQRVLGIPLNLQEFIEDGQEKDLIFGRFEVKAYNDYKNATDASKYQGNAVENCGIDDDIQVMEVFDVPYNVCEHLKKLEFIDPTCNAINGSVYMHQDGLESSSVECIADGPAQEPPTGIYDDGLNREFHNVLTFVFDDGVGMKCSKGMDCPTGCCEEGVCVRLEEGKQCYCDKCEESDGEGGCKPKAKGQTCIYPSQAPCCCDGEGNIVNCPLEPPSSSGGVEDSTNPDGSSSSSGGGGDPTDPDPDNPDNSDEESCDENKDPCCGFEVYPEYNCGMPGPQRAWYCCNPKKDPHECHFDCHNSWYPQTDDYYGLECCLD